MSRYTDFMKKMLPSAKGASQKEKFRWVAAQWKRQKPKGSGLHMAGRGMKSKLTDTFNKQENMSKWSDFGDVPNVSGEGVGRRRGGSTAMSPEEMAVLMKRGPKSDYGIMGKKGCSVPRGGRVNSDYGIMGHKGCSVPRMTPTDERFDMMLKNQKVARGGRVNTLRQRHNQGAGLSGMISARQKAALANLIRHGGKVNTQKGVLADLLKGLDISIN